MPFQVIQRITNNLMASIGILRVNVVNCGIERVASFPSFDRRSFLYIKDHINSRKSTFAFLVDKNAAQL